MRRATRKHSGIGAAGPVGRWRRHDTPSVLLAMVLLTRAELSREAKPRGTFIPAPSRVSAQTVHGQASEKHSHNYPSPHTQTLLSTGRLCAIRMSPPTEDFFSQQPRAAESHPNGLCQTEMRSEGPVAASPSSGPNPLGVGT
jgi:hypothetical protein